MPIMTEEQIQLAIELYSQNKSLDTVGIELGFSGTSIRNQLLKRGIVLRGRHDAQVADNSSKKSEALRLYQENPDWGSYIVADKVGVSHNAVWRWLKENGIDTSSSRTGPRPKEFRDGSKLPRTYSVKSCGNAHQWCKVCRPDISAARTKSSIDTLKAQGKTGPRSGQKMGPDELAAHRQRHQWDNMTDKMKKQFTEKFRGKALTQHSMTRPHQALYKLLTDAGYEVINEHPVGKYSIDCYVPELNIAFEADGIYWHSDQKQIDYDKNRDAWLTSEGGITAVVRISEAETITWS